jgi:acyl-CoA synthetase (NDP forming)/GNAT superfamily N-acetyltransferase
MTRTTGRVRAPLVDGRIVTIRPVDAHDEPALRELHGNLSDTSRYLRFFTFGRTTADAFVHQLVLAVDQPGQGALVAELDERIIAIASYVALADPTVADVALAVADPLQSRGVGTLLFEHLVSLARSRGVRWFTAEVLSANARMLRVFTDAGLPVRTRHEDGEVRVDIRLDVDDAYLDAVAAREIVADTASLRPLLRPASVAVIGASRRPEAVGHAVLQNLVGGGFTGQVYAVNPHADAVLGVRSYPSVAALPEVPDLAVVCVPARRVPDVAEECGRRGVRALAILSAGVTGQRGLEQRVREAVRDHGMRLVGPNCLGVASRAGGDSLDATFARALPPPGPVGVVTQSGGVGIALLEQLARAGIGVSTFVSTGDKYDVSSNDLLMWWERDPATRLAVLYLESFGNPRKFARVARRLGRTKPVLAVRSGTSDVARRAAASHTAATATPVVTRDALFRQAGVVVVDGITDLVAATAVLACQPLPDGRRIAVVSNAGGAGVLAADACAAAGLELPELAPGTRETLAALVPPTASLANPVDTTAAVPVDAFAACLRAVLADPGIDGMIAISAPTALGDLSAAIPAVAGADKPVLAVRLDQAEAVAVLPVGGVPVAVPPVGGVPVGGPSEAGPPVAGTGAGGVPGVAGSAVAGTAAGGVPSFADPAVAVAAYARAAGYAAWRRAPRGRIVDLSGVDIDSGRRAVVAALARQPDGGWLDPAETGSLLRSFGIPLVTSALAASAGEAVLAAARIGGPVAMKAVVPGLLHKSDEGGVLLGLAGEPAVRDAYAALRERFGATLGGVVVQPMIPAGVETLVGVVSDPTFGPLVVFGAGGVITDLVGDRISRLAPVTDLDAAEMVRGLRSSPLLFGYRGAAPSDHAAVEDVLMRVGQVAESLPEVAELELNPLIVHPEGCIAVDARVKLVPREPADPYLRRLR